MRERPCGVDASTYGILVNLLGCPIEWPLKDYAMKRPDLVDDCRRLQAEGFPEWPRGANVVDRLPQGSEIGEAVDETV